MCNVLKLMLVINLMAFLKNLKNIPLYDTFLLLQADTNYIRGTDNRSLPAFLNSIREFRYASGLPISKRRPLTR